MDCKLRRGKKESNNIYFVCNSIECMVEAQFSWCATTWAHLFRLYCKFVTWLLDIYIFLCKHFYLVWFSIDLVSFDIWFAATMFLHFILGMSQCLNRYRTIDSNVNYLNIKNIIDGGIDDSIPIFTTKTVWNYSGWFSSN